MDRKTEARDHSVAASEVIKSIITTGNNSPVFVGRYERLRDAVIQPDEVFRRVHIESFVGRRWLIDQVDSILRANSCGYLVLEAHAGLGKTAFLAWLVKERNYVHHFVELAPGQEGIERGLRNLAAQLIVAYKLSADEAIPDASGRPDYLYRLLSNAAEKRGPGEMIVVIVDALDEAGTPPNQNVLGLPEVLPEGVFFIVSMRPVKVALQSDKSTTPRWPLKILAESEENLQDLRSFLMASAAWPKVDEALKESEYTAEEFIDALMKKSQGLWIYLHFVIPEIERGERSPLDLSTLPEGLQEYYASYWFQWRKDEKWYDLYLQILTALAAAQESSTLDRILDWAGIEAQAGERSRLRSILKEQWRPFLAISGEGKMEKYRFYHATVREFFEGRVEQNCLLQPEIDLLNELSGATSEMHRIIAERYLVIWGGLEKRLPDLENKKEEDNGYGLSHLAAHLEASGQQEKLYCLLNLETLQGRNLWFEVKEARGDTTGYINDITRAWRLAEKRYDPKDIEKTGQLIGLQIRYALIFASINSLSDNIPSELLLALVENGIWSKEEGLAHAKHVPDLNERSIAITKLSSLLKEPKFLDEALAVAREIQNEGSRAKALAEIAPNLQDTQEALAIAREIKDRKWHASTLAKIALNLQDAQKRDLLDEALTVAREIKDERSRDRALAEIAPKLQDIQEALIVTREIKDYQSRNKALAEIAPKLQDIQEALIVAREIKKEWSRAGTLAEIAPKLQDAHEALTVAREIKDKKWRASTLAKIAPKLQDAQKRDVLDEALTVAREIKDKKWRASALAKIAPNFQDAQKKDVLDEALAVAREIKDERSRDRALAEIAPKLQDIQEALIVAREIKDEWSRAGTLEEIAPKLQDAHEALIVAREIKYKWWRASTLAKIAPKLQDAQKRDVLDEALTVAREIKNEWYRNSILEKIALNLQDAHEALAVAREIKGKKRRASTLAKIAPKLQDIQEALIVAQEIKDKWWRARALAEIAPNLKDTQEALAVAREIKEGRSRASTLAKIALNLQDAQKRDVLDEALTVAREIKEGRSRASTLAKIALNLHDAQKWDVLDEALAAAREIKEGRSRASTLAKIALNLQDAQKRDVLDEALTVAREIQNEGSRAKALAEIALNLQDAQKRDVLDEALTVAREIKEGWSRASTLAKVILSLLAEQTLIDFSLWPPTIHGLSSRRRSDLLSDLSSLTPLVARLGGDAALLETARAIKDVGRWWP